MVTSTDINNANIALKNAEIALIQAQADYQKSQSSLNKLIAQQRIDGLIQDNVALANAIAANAAAAAALQSAPIGP